MMPEDETKEPTLERVLDQENIRAKLDPENRASG
jgi:hypothetical protein